MWVKFDKDIVTVYVEREVTWGGGKDESGQVIPPSKQDHISKYSIMITTTEDASGTVSRNFKPLGGKIGGISTPGLFAAVAKAPVDKLMKNLDKEMKQVSKMIRIKINDGSIEMTSRPVVKVISKSQSEKVR